MQVMQVRQRISEPTFELLSKSLMGILLRLFCYCLCFVSSLFFALTLSLSFSLSLSVSYICPCLIFVFVFVFVFFWLVWRRFAAVYYYDPGETIGLCSSCKPSFCLQSEGDHGLQMICAKQNLKQNLQNLRFPVI